MCRPQKKISWAARREVKGVIPMRNFFDLIKRNARRIALWGGIALLVLSYALAFFYPAQFFRAYLVGFVFWLSLALGCLTLLMLHHLAKGAWGASILRILEAGARTIPWLTLIGLPLYFSIPTLFVWARPEAVSANPLLQHKAIYLNVPFFVGRTIFYFAVWNGLVFLFDRWSRERDATDNPRYTDKMRRVGAVGLVVLGLTTTFAAIDWFMSLEPEWYSTIFAATVVAGGVLAALAFAILVMALLSRRPPISEIASPQLFNDLGNFLITFVMLWAYLAFSQYLLIWIGNLRPEIPWYLHRINGGWEFVALAIGLLYFALPFTFLIFRDVKRSTWLLAIVAAVLVATRWLDGLWLIAPTFEATFTITLLDVSVTFGMGGVWLALFARELSKRPLLAPTEPKLEEAREWARTPSH